MATWSTRYGSKTVPRESSVSAGWNWVLGNDTTITVARSSYSFTHSIWIDTWNNTGWVNIKSFSNVGTSVKSNFSALDIGNMATHMRATGSTNTSIKTRIRVQTYSGSTKIGGIVEKEGRLTNTNPSTLTAGVGVANTGIPYSIRRLSNSEHITHLLHYQFGSFSKDITLSNSDSNNGVLTFTNSELDSIYQQVKDTTNGRGGFELTTYISGIPIQEKTSFLNLLLVFLSSDIAPTITDNFTFRDMNASTVAITGNNQIAIQNKSNIYVYIPANNTTFKHGATGKMYSVNINGVEKTVDYSDGAITVPFGEVTTGTNTTIALSIIDSRGIKVPVYKQLVVYAYNNPTLSGIVSRDNGFDELTAIRASGSIASVNGKNKISSVQYRFKSVTSGTYGNYISLSPILTGTNYTTSTAKRSFDNTGKYDIEFRMIDSVGTTITKVVQLDSGKPIVFMDKKHKSVGIGKFPEYNNSLEIDGDIYVGTTRLTSNPTQELKISTSNGYIDIGAKNSAYAHIYTDRSSFYFNKELKVLGNDVYHTGNAKWENNSNGEYIRYPDGTLIQRMYRVYDKSNNNFYYALPASFNSSTYSGFISTTSEGWLEIEEVAILGVSSYSPSQIRVGRNGTVGWRSTSTTTIPMVITLVGRWK